MKERWKPVVTYEGLYEVSNYGRIRSVARIAITKKGHRYTVDQHEVKPYVNENGYAVVGLTRKGKHRLWKVHRLVMLAFTKWDLERGDVNHKDGNKLNNRLDNLEWCTKSENMHHASKTGLRDYDSIRREYRVTVDNLDFTTMGVKAAAKRLHKEGYFTNVSIDNLRGSLTRCALSHQLYCGKIKIEAIDDPFEAPKEYHRCGIKGRRIVGVIDGKKYEAKGPAKLADKLHEDGYFLEIKRDTLLKALSEVAFEGRKYRGILTVYFIDD